MALEDATTARARALAVDLDEAATRLAAHPYAIKRTQPDALSHAPSPDAHLFGEPGPEALAEKMINAAGQWITVNSKTTKKTTIQETTTTVVMRGEKRKTITETTSRIEIEGDDDGVVTIEEPQDLTKAF